MALIKCPECGADVSEFAPHCPKCGFVINSQSSVSVSPTPTKKKSPRGWIVAAIVLICAIGAGAYFYLTSGGAKEGGEAEEVAADAADAIVEITPEFSEKIKDYREIRSFSHGLAAVMTTDRKWGFIDTKGDLIIPTIYDKVNDFKEGLALVSNKTKVCYLDPTGKEVLTLNKDDYTAGFVHGKAAVFQARWDGDKWKYFIGDKVRIINKLGETICEIPITNEMNFVDNDGEGVSLRGVVIKDDGFLVPTSTFDQYLKYDYQGIYIGKVEYNPYHEDDEAPDYSKYDYIVFKEESHNANVTRYGIKDRQGNIIVPAKEWRFVEGVTERVGEYYDYNNDTRKTYINPTNGVFLVKLTEWFGLLNDIDFNHPNEGEGDSYGIYYGFVDMNGNDTFSDRLWERQKIQTYNRINNLYIR